jgi:hypothetical protein
LLLRELGGGVVLLVVVTGLVVPEVVVVDVVTTGVEGGAEVVTGVVDVVEVMVTGLVLVAGVVGAVVPGVVGALDVLALPQADDIASEASAAPPITMPAFLRNSLRDKPCGSLFSIA